MTTRSKYMKDNLECATHDILSEEHLMRINGNGTQEYPGIDCNNRLIWGQVFLWPEADDDWRVLWNDSQVFETRKDFEDFKEAWAQFQTIKKTTTYNVE